MNRQLLVMLPPTSGGGGITCSGHLSVRYHLFCISVLSGGISMQLSTDIQHVSGNCWKGLQGQKLKVKVTYAHV